MAKQPAANETPETETKTEEQLAAELAIAKKAWRKDTMKEIIPKIIAGCNYDMDKGAIFGRVHSRLEKWLAEQGGDIGEIDGFGKFIQEEVAKHIALRDKQAAARMANLAARQNVRIQDALDK